MDRIDEMIALDPSLLQCCRRMLLYTMTLQDLDMHPVHQSLDRCIGPLPPCFLGRSVVPTRCKGNVIGL